jgi:LysM repeat protein
MDNKGSISGDIAAYRRRKQQGNIVFVYGAAGLLVVAGIGLLVLWLNGPSKPLATLFATDTPTPTITYTPTLTSTPTETPTITATATLTATATPSAPWFYTVQEGDSLAVIVENNNLGDTGIPLIMMLNPYDAESGTGIDPVTQIVYPGQQIWLPFPGMPLPTATPIPPNLARGTIVTYIVQAGDSLAGIAGLFNSTVEEIVTRNELPDANAIYVGQTLEVPVNLVTPTATRPPTSTPRTPVPPGTPTAG